MSRVTLREVAAASGVSRATASFVLNDAPGNRISEATRKRVLEVADSLGYAPHGIAKALADGMSRIVVLTVDDRLDGNFTQSFIHGLDSELEAHGHLLLVRHTQDLPRARKQAIDATAPRAVLDLGGGYLRGRDLDDVGGGWRDGMAAHTAAQIRYLADRGHTDVAMAVPDRNAPLGKVRPRFAEQTAAELGLPPIIVFTMPGRRAAVSERLKQFLAEHPKVSAIAGLNDDIALRTLAALHDLGLRAPDDVAVIGYDDTRQGEFSVPALTTVRIDAETHGRITARTILELDSSDVPHTPARVIVRESA